MPSAASFLDDPSPAPNAGASVASPAAASPAPQRGSAAAFLDDSGGSTEQGSATTASPMSAAEKFGTGLMDPLFGGAQLAAHLIPKGLGDTVEGVSNAIARATGQHETHGLFSGAGADKAIAEREKSIQAGGGDNSWWRLAGDIASPVNYVMPAVGDLVDMGMLARAAEAGATSAVLQPMSTSEHFWNDKAKEAIGGAVAGAGTNLLGRAGAHLINPAGGQAQDLMREGIRLTPGQMMGGIARRAEEAARSIPIVGSAIRRGEQVSVDDFNRAVYNRVLQPIGQQYQGNNVGYRGIETLRNQLSDEYDRILSGVSFRADQQFVGDVRNLHSLVQEMPPDQVQQFERILNNRVAQRLQPTGTMDGYTFQQVHSELSEMAAQYHGSADAAHRQLGDAIDEVNSLLRDNLARQNPQQRAELDAVDRAYMMYARVRRAAANRGTSEGVFSPTDLMSALKASDRSRGKGQFATGHAPLQDIAQAGVSTIRPHMGDSYTPERMFWRDLALGGGAAAYLNNPLPLLAGAGLYGAYTPPAMSVMRRLALAGATNGGRGQMLLSPYLAVPAGVAVGQGSK